MKTKALFVVLTKFLLIVFSFFQPNIASAQDNAFDFKFYGRIRADIFYNSRANNENVDGLFYLYPKDKLYDDSGADLNASAQGGMYALYTRLGVDIKGPAVGNAKSTAKIEVDFRGTGTNFGLLRIRHAYVNLAWENSQILIGQTWHPLFGEVSPSMLNLSTGAPFQPFSRCPQIRFRYLPAPCIQFTASAMWQQQYTSIGPNGKSQDYLKNSCIPELFVGIDYKSSNSIVGIGAELLSLRPRKSATVGDKIYKVDERVTSVSIEAHAKYATKLWTLSGKSVLANNLTQTSMLGGFAVTAIDPLTGKFDYTPFRHSMTWLNFVYGKKWQPGVFLGYLKNLGTGKEIVGQQYGLGLDVDQLMTINTQLSYNLPHWKLGVEFSPSIAWYGKTEMNTGKVISTHSVANYRLLAVMMYIF